MSLGVSNNNNIMQELKMDNGSDVDYITMIMRVWYYSDKSTTASLYKNRVWYDSDKSTTVELYKNKL